MQRPPDVSEPMYKKALKAFEQALSRPVAPGRFGADMQISLLNDGPVTIVIDSKDRK